jgi:antitoxin component of RelBE/YafQ-DinJ toxin-antitoxin module
MMKSDSLKIRLGPEEKQAFQDAAELAGVALSAWIRERLRKAARHELEEAGLRIPFLVHRPVRDREGTKSTTQAQNHRNRQKG